MNIYEPYEEQIALETEQLQAEREERDESLCDCGEPLDEKEELCPECLVSKAEMHRD